MGVRGFTGAVMALGILMLSGFAKAPVPLLFGQSEVARRLGDLGHEVSLVRWVRPDQLLVALYVPFQGALSDWDDETRLVLFRPMASGEYERVQFVSRAGASLPGRARDVVLCDLDGDHEREIVASGSAVGARSQVTLQIYRRAHADARFAKVYERRESRLDWTFDALRRRLLLTFVDYSGRPHRQGVGMNDDGTPTEINTEGQHG